MAADNERMDSSPPALEQPPTTTLLQVVRRRWPWLVVGVVLGLIGGFFWTTSKPDVFESRSQVLVVKKRSDLNPTSDSRTAVVEDYVATQVTLIKSERILTAAAKNIPSSLHHPLPGSDIHNPEDMRARTLVLKAMLAVSREKDTSAPTAGTNILNLSYRSSDPEDCKVILNSIIESYRDQLKTVYTKETDRKLQEYDFIIRGCNSDDQRLNLLRSEAKGKMLQVTTEDPASIRARLSQSTTSSRSLELEKRDLEGRLALIRSTGPDVRDRRKVLTMLGDAARDPLIVKTDLNSPEAMIRSLQLERADLSEKYAEEHQTIKQIDGRIRQLTELNRQLNPQDPTGEKDPLAVIELILSYRLASVKSQLASINEDLRKDQETLTKAAEYSAIIEQCDQQLLEVRKRRNETEVQKKLTEATQDAGGFEATTINEPVAGVKVEPRLSIGLMYGLVMGLMGGLAVGAFAELTDRSFRSPNEIRTRLGVPVVGHVPTIRINPAEVQEVDLDPSLITAHHPKSPESEAYRSVRTTLYFSTIGKGHQVIQVTSPNPGDGKSTLAANLAISIAQSGKRVVLIDADFRKPRVNKLFRLRNPGPGLASVIIGEATLAAATIRTVIENLAVIPCGPRPANPAELLTSPRFDEVLTTLKNENDFVIVDTPPLLAVSDPAVVATRVNGVLLIFRMTRSVRPAAERARDQLNHLGAKLIGVVVNGSERAADGYTYGYSDEYEYYADSDDSSMELPRKG